MFVYPTNVFVYLSWIFLQCSPTNKICVSLAESGDTVPQHKLKEVWLIPKVTPISHLDVFASQCNFTNIYKTILRIKAKCLTVCYCVVLYSGGGSKLVPLFPFIRHMCQQSSYCSINVLYFISLTFSIYFLYMSQTKKLRYFLNYYTSFKRNLLQYIHPIV